MAVYNVTNWYWSVAGSVTQVYSSAGAQYVPVTDATYSAWLAAGNRATRIINETELQDVFATQYPAGWPPTLAQQAAAAIAAGLAITSTGTPALDGTYSVDEDAQSEIGWVSNYILVNGKFPGGATQYPWIDMANQNHLFQSTQDFQTFATVVADYVAALVIIIKTNSGDLPIPTAVIP